jgi:hypothetical protein
MVVILRNRLMCERAYHITGFDEQAKFTQSRGERATHGTEEASKYVEGRSA